MNSYGEGEFDDDDGQGGLVLLGRAAAATQNEADMCPAPAAPVAAHVGAVAPTGLDARVRGGKEDPGFI